MTDSDFLIETLLQGNKQPGPEVVLTKAQFGALIGEIESLRFQRTTVFDLVMKAIKTEREQQDLKWGTLNEKQQSIAGYLLILRKELEEAEKGWMKNVPGKHSALSEIVQVAAVAIACLEQHGLTGN